MIREAIKKVIAGEDLDFDESSSVMNGIMDGQASPAQIAALLVALKLKGEKASEVAGFVTAMREHSVKVTIDDENAVDGCGTGGDGSGSFNISTAAALAASAAGVTIAKHGNRSISSRCGSADILEACGGNIDPGPENVQTNINDIGFGFMFAPRFHPAMKHAAGPRKEMGVRTVFNILGPMTNPASVRRQVVGVYDHDLMSLMAEVLEMTGSEHIMVVHSRDGQDEFSLSAPTDFIELRDGQRKVGTLTHEEVGLSGYPAHAIAGGDALANKQILDRIFGGEKGAYRDVVLFNAGAMVYVGGKADSVADGIETVSKAIDSGSAADKLQSWIDKSNS